MNNDSAEAQSHRLGNTEVVRRSERGSRLSFSLPLFFLLRFLYIISRRFRKFSHAPARSISSRGSWIHVAVGYYVNRLYGHRMREEELEISLKVIAGLDCGLLYVFPFSFQPYRALLVMILHSSTSRLFLLRIRIGYIFPFHSMRAKRNEQRESKK